MADQEQPPGGAKKKILGLPQPVFWVTLIAGGGLLYLWWRNHQAAAASSGGQPAAYPTIVDIFQQGGGAGGSNGGGPPPPHQQTKTVIVPAAMTLGQFALDQKWTPDTTEAVEQLNHLTLESNLAKGQKILRPVGPGQG